MGNLFDPNAILKEMLDLREANLRYQEIIDEAPVMTDELGNLQDDVLDGHSRLCSLVAALDNWICAGGSLPDTWKKSRTFRFQSDDGFTLIWNRRKQRWTDGDLSFKNAQDNFWPIAEDGEYLEGCLL